MICFVCTTSGSQLYSGSSSGYFNDSAGKMFGTERLVSIYDDDCISSLIFFTSSLDEVSTSSKDEPSSN